MLTSISPRPDYGYTASGPRPADTAGQAARSLFPEPAVKIDLSTALRVEGLSLAGSNDERSGPLIVSLLTGFATARRAGQAIRAVFSAMRTEVQTLALKLVEQRAEANRRGAAMLSLLGDIPEAVREQTESLAKHAKFKAEGMQKALAHQARTGPLAGSMASLRAHLTRFADFDTLVDSISRSLKFTAFLVRIDADSRDERQDALATEKKVSRSVSDLQDLKSRPNLALKIDVRL